MTEELAVLVLFTVALLGNVPLGFLRRRSRRWTLPWFIGCDGSVPVLWVMRHNLDVDSWVIFPEILLALIGNIFGPRLILWLRTSPPTPPLRGEGSEPTEAQPGGAYLG